MPSFFSKRLEALKPNTSADEPLDEYTPPSTPIHNAKYNTATTATTTDTITESITDTITSTESRHLKSFTRLQQLGDSLCTATATTTTTTTVEPKSSAYSVITTPSSQTFITSNRSSSSSSSHKRKMSRGSRRNYPQYEEWQDDPEEPSSRRTGGRRGGGSIPLFKSKEQRRQQALARLKEEEPEKYYTMDELLEYDIYKVRQSNGPCSIGFSAVQTIVLLAMMIQCKIAPLNINPMVGPYPDALDYWGGKNAYKIIDEGEMWRLCTPIFLHAGVIHLLCNVSVQLDIGIFWEREWGSHTWLCIYLTSAVGSSILSCCFMPNNVSVGSSGAVMGLMGGKLAEVFCRSCESKKRKQNRIAHEVRKEQCSQVTCSVIVVMLFSFVPYVDWAAHLGGLLAGFAAGMCCFATWIKTRHCAFLWFVVGMILTFTYYGVTIVYMMTVIEPMDDLKDVCGYYKQFFEDYECNCQLDNN